MKMKRSLYLWHCLQEILKQSSWKKNVFIGKKNHNPADSYKLEDEQESGEGQKKHAFQKLMFTVLSLLKALHCKYTED